MAYINTQKSLSVEEWKALKDLASDKTIAIKGADKASSVVVWDRSDYLREASRQLQDVRTYTKMLNSMKTYSPTYLQEAIRNLNVYVVIN